MAINVDNINAATGQTKNANGSQKALDQTFNDFLLLLTTQLKNQDPLDPQDSSQFTSQLAQMSSVQEAVNTNANLEKLIALTGGSQINNAVNYIGRAVEAAGNQSQLIDDGQQKGALFLYDLPVEAKDVTINITDASNTVVYSGPAYTDKGRNAVVWDGKNSLTGQDMPVGTYNFTVLAKDFAGNALEAKTYTTGIVTAVDTQDGDVTLSLGNIRVDVGDVSAIRSAQNLL